MMLGGLRGCLWTCIPTLEGVGTEIQLVEMLAGNQAHQKSMSLCLFINGGVPNSLPSVLKFR